MYITSHVTHKTLAGGTEAGMAVGMEAEAGDGRWGWRRGCRIGDGGGTHGAARSCELLVALSGLSN